MRTNKFAVLVLTVALSSAFVVSSPSVEPADAKIRIKVKLERLLFPAPIPRPPVKFEGGGKVGDAINKTIDLPATIHNKVLDGAKHGIKGLAKSVTDPMGRLFKSIKSKFDDYLQMAAKAGMIALGFIALVFTMLIVAPVRRAFARA